MSLKWYMVFILKKSANEALFSAVSFPVLTGVSMRPLELTQYFIYLCNIQGAHTRSGAL